jgi:CBS domain-containing protein
VFINALLGAFNLLPGFPLDGGRVLRSIVWSVTGSLQRATTVASYVGQAFAFVLIFWGVLQLFSGNFLGGLWIAVIGWFLNSGAETSRQATRTQELLRGRKVSDVMATNPRTVASDLDTRSFVHDYVMRQGVRALPVVDDGRLVGIMSITDAKDVPTDSWPVVPVGRIMTPTPLKTTTPGTELSEVIQQIGEEGVHQLPVVEGGQLVGMITRADILRYLQVTGELGSASGRWQQRGHRDRETRRAA